MAFTIPTPNKDPVPSADIKNVVFAGAKIDEFATSINHYYIDRLGVQRFTAAGLIYYYGIKFQEAIASSGYTVIGRYEDGIQTLSNYNETIEYNGEFYKLKPRVTPPFTTTGTTSETWGNDSEGLVSVGDAIFREDLSKKDGYKLLGKCNSLIELRTIEPTDQNQQIILSSAVDSGPIFNAILTYDRSDASTPDNGVSVFVTPNGARWKADISKGYHLYLAGFDGTNLVACVHKIRDVIISNYRSNSANTNASNKIFIPLPPDGTAKYSASSSLILPPFIELALGGSMTFDYSSTGDGTHGLVVSNSESGIETAFPSYHIGMDLGNQVISGGYLTIRKPYSTTDTTSFGVLLGNLKSGYMAVRDVAVNNIIVFGFRKSFGFGTYDTYICGYDSCRGSLSYNGIAFAGNVRSNSGERLFFKNGTLGDQKGDIIDLGCRGMELFLRDNSLDYCQGHLINQSSDGRSEVYISGGHIEGVQGLLFNNSNKTALGVAGTKVVINMSSVDLTTGQSTGLGAYKNWVYSNQRNDVVIIKDTCKVFHCLDNTQPNGPYPTLMHPATNNYATLVWEKARGELPQALMTSFGQAIPRSQTQGLVATSNFIGTEGSGYQGYWNSPDNYGWYALNGSWYVGPLDADGNQSIEVTASATSDVFYVVCAIPVFCNPGEVVRSFGSAKVATDFTGNVNIATYYEQYSQITMASGSSAAPVAGASSYTRTNTGYGSVIDLGALSKSKVGLGNWQGFSLPGAKTNINGFKLSPPSYCFIGFRLTGFTGKLSLKFLSVTTQTKMGE